MMEWLQNFSTWAQAHTTLALGVVFVVSFIDCLFVIGTFVVFAALVLFATGALVAMGAFDFWPAVLTTATGGLLGDSVSYLIGRHYGVALFRAPFFTKRPAIVERGRQFFARHGGKGLVIAHNIGLLRAMLPAMAGAYGLKPLRFALSIVPAALIWALAYIGPGVLFGASMGLAAEVTKRLAILIVGLGALLWLTLWLSWTLTGYAQGHAQAWLGRMMEIARNHRMLGRLGPQLADPQQPETPALALFSVTLFTLAAVVSMLIWGIAPREQPPGVDLAVYQALRSIEEPWATGLAVFFSLLGEWQVYLPYAIAALLTLMWSRSRRAAAHWIAALLFGSAITLGLSAVPNISNPLEYSGLVVAAHFPRDLVMAAVIYGFTPVLLAGGSQRPHTSPYALTLTTLLLILLARLYLGTIWLSVGLIAVIVGLLWVGALGVGYRLHAPEQVPVRRFLPALLVLVLAMGWHQHRNFDLRQNEHTPAPVSKPLTLQGWWKRDWSLLRARRQDMAGRDKQYLNLQWAGNLEDIREALVGAGWTDPEPLSFTSSLMWLSSKTPISEISMLPRYHAGRHEALRLRRAIDDDHQYSLRLWPSGYLLDGETPLWTGTLVQQEAQTVFKIFRYPTNENIFTAALDSLELPLPGFEGRRVQREGVSYATQLLKPAPESPAPAPEKAAAPP